MPVRVRSYHPHTIEIDGQPVRLRLARMTPAQFEDFRAVFEARASGRDGAPGEDAPLADRQAYAQRTVEWVEGVFTQYVQVEGGDLVREIEAHDTVDGVTRERVVTDGVEFLRLFQGEGAGVLGELFLVNHLSEAQKKSWRSLPGSGTGSSTAPSPAAPGRTPVTVAPPAAGEASAAPEDATAPSSDASSGGVDPSCSAPAPCVI